MLTSKIGAFVQAVLTNTSDLAPASAPLDLNIVTELGNGTGTGMADKAWYDTRQVAASSNDDLDLAGSLVNAVGETTVFARIKGIIVRAKKTNTNNVVVGAAAATPWAALLGAAGTVTLRPGATFAAFVDKDDATSYAVTGGSADILRVANSGGGSAVDYDIILIGASA